MRQVCIRALKVFVRAVNIAPPGLDVEENAEIRLFFRFPGGIARFQARYEVLRDALQAPRLPIGFLSTRCQPRCKGF